MRYRLLALVAGAMLAATPAQAQFAVTVLPSIIGNAVGSMGAASAEDACMIGLAMPASEIAEARAPSMATLRAYFVAAQAGAPRSAAFLLDGKTRLTIAGVAAPATGIDAVRDPLALPGAVLVDAPLRFYRSGMDATALGQWLVRDAQGATAGVYTGYFVRKAGAWRLRTLTVSVPGEPVAPAQQFCHAPGDVAPYKVTSTKAFRDYAEKRLAKGQARAAAARAAVERDATRRSATREEIAFNRAEATRLAAEETKRTTDLAEARIAETKALDAEREIARRTVDARNGAQLAEDEGAARTN